MAKFIPVSCESQADPESPHAHFFNWIDGSYQHTGIDDSNFYISKDGINVDSKRTEFDLLQHHETGKLCANISKETNVSNAPSLFLIHADGTGAQLSRDADMYSYLKNLSSRDCEVIEEAIEDGTSINVFERSVFRQIIRYNTRNSLYKAQVESFQPNTERKLEIPSSTPRSAFVYGIDQTQTEEAIMSRFGIHKAASDQLARQPSPAQKVFCFNPRRNPFR